MATKAEVEAQAKRAAAAKKAARTKKANTLALENKKKAAARSRARSNPPGGGISKLIVGGVVTAGAATAVSYFAPAGMLAKYGAIVAPAIIGYMLRKKAKWRAIGDAMLVGSATLGAMMAVSAFLPAANPPRGRGFLPRRNPAAPSLLTGSMSPGSSYAQQRAAGLVL